MIDPQHRAREQTTQAEQAFPHPSIMPAVTKPFAHQSRAVKRDVTGFVADDQPAHAAQRFIPAMTVQHLVIHVADDFGQQQNVEFEPDAEPFAQAAEQPKTPMAGDRRTAKTREHFAKQARVFGFFGEPQIDQRSNTRIGSQQPLAIPSDQVGRTSAIAELELLDRAREFRPRLLRNIPGRMPRGLGTIETVLLEVTDPVVDVHDESTVKDAGKIPARRR